MARFPMGDGTCTKVPTILQLKKGTGHTVEVGPPGNIRVRAFESLIICHISLHTTHTLCTHFKALPASCSTKEVVQAISNAQTEILKAKFPNYTPSDIQFSPTPVTVVASTPNIPTEIVLVDLPGMLASMDPKAAAVKEMVLEQIISKSTLIVAAGKSDNDDNTMRVSTLPVIKASIRRAPGHCAPTPSGSRRVTSARMKSSPKCRPSPETRGHTCWTSKEMPMAISSLIMSRASRRSVRELARWLRGWRLSWDHWSAPPRMTSRDSSRSWRRTSRSGSRKLAAGRLVMTRT